MTSGAEHDQIRLLGGSVNLVQAITTSFTIARPRIEATLNFNPVTGDQFRIIDNAGPGGTTGRFSTTAVTLSGQQFAIATNAGDGNDVILTTL